MKWGLAVSNWIFKNFNSWGISMWSTPFVVYLCVNPKPNCQDRSSILTNFGNCHLDFLFYFLARPFVNIFCWTSVVSMVSGLHHRVKLTNNSHYEEVEGDEGATTCKGQSVFSHNMFAWLGVISWVTTATLLLACSSLFNDKFSHNPQQKVSPPMCKKGPMISAFLSLTPPWVGWLIYWHSMHKKTTWNSCTQSCHLEVCRMQALKENTVSGC
jgi:hypothetical protein